MALSRVTTWTAGQTLTAAALNGEFNNILNNALTLISPLTGNLNVNGKQLTNVLLEPRATNPTVGSAGRVWFNTATAEFRGEDGTRSFSLSARGGMGVSGLRATSTGLTGNFIFDANRYVFKTTDGISQWSMDSTATVTVIVTSSDGGSTGIAANGRDQASTFTSTAGFLHFYCIATGPFSTTPAGLASLTIPPATPTLPSSYTGICYLMSVPFSGAVFTSGYARGATWFYSSEQSLVTSGDSTTATNVGATATVPPNALRFGVQSKLTITASAGAAGDDESTGTLYLMLTGYSSAFPIHTQNVTGFVRSLNGGQTYESGSAIIQVPNLVSTPQFRYAIQQSIGTTTAASARLDLVSYTVANGDV